MLDNENNQEETMTNEDAVVNQSELETTVNTEVNTNEPLEATEMREVSEEEHAASLELPAEPTVSEPEIELPIMKHDEEDEDEETKMIDEEDAISQDFSAFTKAQLLEMAVDAPRSLSPREAVKKIQNIRPFFDSLLKIERQEQLQKFIEEGNEEETFEFNDDGSKVKFYDAFKMAQEARSEEKKRIEDEKLKNLEIKNSIIDRIKVLTESDETVHSIEEIKKLQNEWKAIRAVPKNYLQELYDRYHFYLDKFYDNLAINRELKELDRKMNLSTKIELCNKVDALQKEPSLKRAFILLAKYQEEFKNTGPVPKEFSEEIWSRFKSTVDHIYSQRKAQFDVIQEKRNENLKLKEVLVEKARLIASHTPTKLNDWKSNFDELNKLMDEWKTVGQVPKANNETIWQQFREQFNVFSKNRNEFYKRLNSDRKSNIALKEDLCRRAEELKENEDFNYTTKEFLKLQEEWKTVGPVPEAISQSLWKRFRKACDAFFEKKQLHFQERKGQEMLNLELKQAVINELTELESNTNGEEVLAKLRELQEKWNAIGFVPLKHKKDITDTYQTKSNAIYKKFRSNRDQFKQAHMKEHYHQISSQPGGDKKLGDDERRLREKIRGLKTEIETWENNIEFFARSKNADKFRKDIEDKIARANGQIEGLNKELAVLRAAKTEKV